MKRKFIVIPINEDKYTIQFKNKGNVYASDIVLTDDAAQNAKLIESVLNNIFLTGKKNSDKIELRPIRVQLKADKKLASGQTVNEEDITAFME